MRVSYKITRELRDMDEYINNLRGVSSDLFGIIDTKYTRIIDEVILEWEGYTKPLIEDLSRQIGED